MLSTLTVDIGTTSVKLCLFGEDASLLFSARPATPVLRDDHGQVYDVEALHRLVHEFVRGLPSTQRAGIRRIALTGVGESGGLVCPDGTPASPMILWHDHRGATHLERLSTQQRSRLYRITGLPVNGNYALSKVAWALEHTEAVEDVVWLNIVEHLAAVLTGERWAEPSLASRTMALDVGAGIWSAEACAMLGVDPGVFPALRPAASGVPIAAAVADALGLSRDVEVHVAGHDHMVGAIGAGLERGELLNSTGTTEGLLLLADTPRLDDGAEASKLANGRPCAGQDYTLFASIPTGGSAFATLQRMLAMDEARLSACVTSVHRRYLAGEVELRRAPLVLPRFRGSPPPTKDGSARGVIAGIGDDTTAEDIVLGCFLGLVLQHAEVLDLFGTAPAKIKVIGPAVRNDLWMQLKADLLGTPLSASRADEVVSRGAQALASGARLDWRAHDPVDVVPDVGRHGELRDWTEQVMPLWRHLQESPS